MKRIHIKIYTAVHELSCLSSLLLHWTENDFHELDIKNDMEFLIDDIIQLLAQIKEGE